MDPLNNVPQGWDTSVRDENGLRTVPWSSVLGCVVGRNGARGGISPGGYGIHMQFRAVKGMAHHPTEDYMLIADACTAPCRGGIYKVYTMDTPSNECGIENNGGKWQTCFDRYMNCPPPAADRSNTCYKYDVKRVTIDPNNVNPSDSYEGVVDGIAIAPSGKYAVLSSSGGQSGSWLRVLDLETYGLSDYIGGHGGNGGRDGRRDGTLAVRPFCVQQGYSWQGGPQNWGHRFVPRYLTTDYCEVSGTDYCGHLEFAVISNPWSMSVGASPSPAHRAPLRRKSAMTRRALRISAVHSQRQEPDSQRQGSRWERRTPAHRRNPAGGVAHVHHRVWRPR